MQQHDERLANLLLRRVDGRRASEEMRVDLLEMPPHDIGRVRANDRRQLRVIPQLALAAAGHCRLVAYVMVSERER